MDFYSKKNYEYDKSNSYNYDYSNGRTNQKSIEYYETTDGTVEEIEDIEVLSQIEEDLEEEVEEEMEEEIEEVEYFEHKEEAMERSEERHISYEKSNEFDAYCAKCYKFKDIAGDKWEKSNELADCARKIGLQAKKAEEKADYYKKLVLEECENANRLWDEYRCISNESIELMREARKYMTKFEDCLRECDKDEHKCDPNCYDENECDCKPDNRQKSEPRVESKPKSEPKQESKPEPRSRSERRSKQDYGYNNQRR